MGVLSGLRLDCLFWGRKGVAHRPYASLNKVLDTLGYLDLVSIVHVFVNLYVGWVDRVSKLESTFFLLLENVWADHELLGGGQDGRVLLLAHARSEL